MLTLTIKLEDGHCDNLGDTISISQTDAEGTLNVVIITRSDIHRIQSMLIGAPVGPLEAKVDLSGTSGASSSSAGGLK